MIKSSSAYPGRHLLKWEARRSEDGTWAVWKRDVLSLDEPLIWKSRSGGYTQKDAEGFAAAMEFDAHNLDEKWFCDNFCDAEGTKS